jgi:uncharacterized protein
MIKLAMNNLSTIPKESSAGPDYSFLRQEGLKYIEQLSHKLWTDYNIHDPGITMLEMLCYAITDLGYRTSYSMEDILASEKNNMDQMHKQFLSAIKVLPSNPLTANDYRQLFVRINGVRNAWILPSKQSVVAQYHDVSPKGMGQLHYKQPDENVDTTKAHEFDMRGLNKILLDFDESAMLEEEEKSKPAAEQEALMEEKKMEVTNRVMEVYQRYRNLCEDIDTIEEVPLQGVVICGEIEIQPTANAEQVWAQIVFNIQHYLSPDIPFYNLQEMQESGKSTDEIFDGPVFDFDDNYAYRSPGNPFIKKGFVKKEDLNTSELRTEVRLSDIISIIMKTDGVKLVKEIAFGLCSCDEKDMAKVRKAVTSDKWNLCIEPGHKPVFCQTNSVLNIWKDVIPLTLKKEQAQNNLDELIKMRNAQMQALHTEDIPMPNGRYRHIRNYQSFQNHFPETYGIGRSGLPESATAERKSKAKQLKAYLLFFEQVLANYFAQLANTKELLSAQSQSGKSYFANVVKGLKDSDEIFKDENNWEASIESILKKTGLDNYVNRRNRFLDHLLARFSEHFSDYVFLMHRLYDEDAGRAVIRHKSEFLSDYHNMSTGRSSGFDYYNPQSDELQKVNIPGMEKRISRLLGFNHYKRGLLSELSYKIEKTGTTTLTINEVSKEVPTYGWSIQGNGKTILESINKELLTRNEAYEEMGLASMLGCEREYYKIIPAENESHVTITLHNTSSQPGVPGDAIAKHPDEYELQDGETHPSQASLAEEAKEQMINNLLHDFRLEGMYVVEHLLLRPDAENNNHELFLPVCIESNGEYCKPLDPYSFRITIILPGYSMRLRNKNFRQFAERLIRMETPAHVLPRICFVNQEHMAKFEHSYNNWLTERISSPTPQNQAQDSTLTELIEVLGELFTTYESGYLTGCDDDTPEKSPIVLGSSKLGSIETEQPL